jgi:hypothetical protein
MNKKLWNDFRKSFDDFIVGDIQKSLEVGIEVGTIILTIIGIECLSGYFMGRESNPRTFRHFIHTFMPEYYSIADALYKCIRNGLMHDYIIKEFDGTSFIFTRNEGEKHLIPLESNPKWYYLNREDFARDFLIAQNNYFKQVEIDNELFKKANKRLKKRSFLAVFSFYQPTQFIGNEEISDGYFNSTGTASKPPCEQYKGTKE